MIVVMSPWLSAVMLCLSCSLFFLLRATIGSSSAGAFLYGAIGYFSLAATFSMLVLNYCSGRQIRWQEGEIGMSLAYFIISASFSFLCIAGFYAGFLGSDECIETHEAQ
jgi:hypothetical protein